MAKTAKVAKPVQSLSEVFTALETNWNAFVAAHNGTKKRNTADARKALGELKKLVTPYRFASVAASKAAKA